MTNYSSKIEQSITGVYQVGIATKILQHMGRIRNVSDINQARRWGMELLQNSRDVAYEGQAVRVQIELSETTLKFRHTGKPFRVQDILSVINQVSSKTPGENTIGQFGTGFMTTYQLSESVEIHSILKDEGLPYKPFNIRINRRGRTKEEILQGIQETMQDLKQADNLQDVTDFQKEAFNTCFCYHLENDESRKIAKIGMDDLENTVCYILLFSEKIASIELMYSINGDKRSVLYERGELEILESAIKKLNIYRLEGDKREKQQLIFIKQGDNTLALGWNDEYGFEPISEHVPRLFVDFPLIGAEAFPFPIILNNPKLRTNEPRSGITLVDNATSLDALANKEIMGNAINTYQVLLQYTVKNNMKCIEHLISIPEWKPDKELSECWVKKHIYKRLYNMIAQEAFLETEQGKVRISDSRTYLVEGRDAEEREEIGKLIKVLRNHIVPFGNVDWCRVLAGYDVNEGKIISLEKLVHNAEYILKSQLDESKLSPIDWCKKVYNICREKQELLMEILAGNLKIFPNQDLADWNQRKLFSIKELRRDINIEESLKDVCDILDELSAAYEESLCIRKNLLHKEFSDMEISEMEKYELTKMTNHIISRSSSGFPVKDYNRNKQSYDQIWERAWCIMLSCGSDKELYDMCRVIYRDKLPEYKPLCDTYEKRIWNNTCIGMLRKVLCYVEKYQTVNELFMSVQNENELLASNQEEITVEEDVYVWLDKLFSKVLEYINESELRNRRILPNQRGRFCESQYLQRDLIVDEELKEISVEFADKDKECDVYELLLKKEIKAQFYIGGMIEGMVALRINQVVSKILAEQNLSDETVQHQEACTRLLGWIQDNKEKAKSYFPSFCQEEDQMRLLTPKAAVGMQKKAKALDELLKAMGTDKLEDIREKLEKIKRNEEFEEEEKIYNRNCFDWESDVLYDLEWSKLYSEDDFASILSQIGIEGEHYAKEQVVSYYQQAGYDLLEECSGKVVMEKKKNIQTEEGSNDYNALEVIYLDTAQYHQPGWDICVKKKGNEKEETLYLEIKTHTTKSVEHNILCMSNEQMKMAAKELDNYFVMVVKYNWRERQGEGLCYYRNPVEQIAKGKMKHAEGKYKLQMA